MKETSVVISYSEITSCKRSVLSVQPSTIGRSVAGGVIAGSAGAVVGAMTASKEKITGSCVSIYRKNVVDPEYDIMIRPTNSDDLPDVLTFTKNVEVSINAILASKD